VIVISGGTRSGVLINPKFGNSLCLRNPSFCKVLRRATSGATQCKNTRNKVTRRLSCTTSCAIPFPSSKINQSINQPFSLSVTTPHTLYTHNPLSLHSFSVAHIYPPFVIISHYHHASRIRFSIQVTFPPVTTSSFLTRVPCVMLIVTDFFL
jgi:hypothetical protein